VAERTELTEPRTLIVGDVHGCAEELRLLLDQAAADDVVLVGDLYTKGPDPAGVWALVRDRGLRAVRGNHDQRLIDVLAGQRPRDVHGAEVVARLDAFDLAWRDHLHALPYHLEVAGVTVVHASVHPSGELSATTPRDFMVRRRWPSDKRSDPFWWQVYRGDRRIVYGHDAMRGLVEVRRDDQLHIVGLDTGCVYGGQLTGLLLPEERLLQVEAAEVYKPV
jgi:hypothetical protein